MNKTIIMQLFLATITLVPETAMALPQTAYINAVDLDLVSSERDKFFLRLSQKTPQRRSRSPAVFSSMS